MNLDKTYRFINDFDDGVTCYRHYNYICKKFFLSQRAFLKRIP